MQKRWDKVGAMRESEGGNGRGRDRQCEIEKDTKRERRE